MVACPHPLPCRLNLPIKTEEAKECDHQEKAKPHESFSRCNFSKWLNKWKHNTLWTTTTSWTWSLTAIKCSILLLTFVSIPKGARLHSQSSNQENYKYYHKYNWAYAKYNVFIYFSCSQLAWLFLLNLSDRPQVFSVAFIEIISWFPVTIIIFEYFSRVDHKLICFLCEIIKANRAFRVCHYQLQMATLTNYMVIWADDGCSFQKIVELLSTDYALWTWHW